MRCHLEGAHILGGQRAQSSGGEGRQLVQELPTLGEGGTSGPVGGRQGDRAVLVPHHLSVRRQRRSRPAMNLFGSAQILTMTGKRGTDHRLIALSRWRIGVVSAHTTSLLGAEGGQGACDKPPRPLWCVQCPETRSGES